MLIIVDGYNYIGHSRELELSDPTARDKIVYLMGQYCRRVHKSVTIVFDGNYFVDLADRKRRYGRVTVIYTSPIYTADDMIKKMIRKQESKRRKALLVVSSDNEIMRYAKAHGTSAVKSEDFEYTINQALASEPEIDKTNVHVSSQEVRAWLKIFETTLSDHEIPRRSGKFRKAVSKSETEKLETARAPTAKKNLKKTAEGDVQTSKNRLRLKRKESQSDKSRTLRTGEDLDRINVHLSPEEVQEWMKIFGAETEE